MKNTSFLSRPMCITKFIYPFLLLFLLSSCSNSEGPDYRRIASAIFNDILIDVLDSEGHSLMNNETILNELSFTENDGYKIPFHVVEVGEEKLIRTCFPLPMESSMSYSHDRRKGYGESNLIVNVKGFKFNLRGKFCYTATNRNNIYGGDSIKIIEIHSDNPKVSISGETDFLKIRVNLPFTGVD